MINLMNNIIGEIEKGQKTRAKELLRRQRISVSLKAVNKIKRNEKGYHRVYFSEMGERVGYYLLPNLYK